MAQNQNQVVRSLVETAVDIEPVAVVFNLENSDIENFVYNYLAATRNIEGVAAVLTHVVRDGSRNPELAVYAFFDQKSNDIFSNMRKVPEHLRRKMDTGGYRAGDKLQKALQPIAGELKLSSDERNKLVYIKLNVFKVIGLMLGADPRKHELVVSEVAKVKKRSIATVIKKTRFVGSNDNNFDKFSNIIERNEH